MGMTAGVIGVTAGVAGAATSTQTLTRTPAAAPAINPNGTSQTVGKLTDALAANTVVHFGGTTFTFTLGAPSVHGKAVWSSAPTVACYHTAVTAGKTVACTATVTAGTPTKLLVHVTGTTTSTTDTHLIVLTGVKLTTSTTAHGTIDVKSTATGGATGFAVSATLVLAKAKVAGTITSAAKTAIPATVPSDSAHALAVTIPATWGLKHGTTYTLNLGVSSAGVTKWTGATVSTKVNITGTAVAVTLGTTTTKLTFDPTAPTTAVTFKVAPTFSTTRVSGTVSVSASLSGVTYGAFAASAVPAQVLTVTPSTHTASIALVGTKTSVGSTAKSATAASLKVTITKATAAATKLFLHVATATGTRVVFKALGYSTETGIVPTAAATGTGTATVEITIPANAHGSFVVSGVAYTNTTAHGTITVTAMLLTNTRAAATHQKAAFSPATVANAVAPAAPTPGPSTVTLAAMTTAGATFPVGVGGTNQVADTLTLTFADASKTTTEVIPKGAVVEFAVKKHGGANCTAGNNFVGFDGTPKVGLTATTSNHVSGTPKLTVSVTRSAAGCVNNTKTDALKIKFTTALTLAKNATKAPKAVFVISGIHYSVGSKTTTTDATVKLVTVKHTTLPATTITNTAANAKVSLAWVTTTEAKVQQNAFDASINPISVVEAPAAAGQVITGWVCAKITGAHKYFNTAAKATVTVAKGNGKVASTVEYLPATSASATTVAFDVTTASTTTASTYTLSGLAVNAPGTANTTVKVTVTYGATSTCALGNRALTVGTRAIFKTGTSSTTIYGATATATAVQELETAFPAHTGAGTACTGGTHAVVLATNKTFQDALSSQYLAKALGTGTLLTGVTQISSTTLNAIRIEGIQTVYIVGGPLAVSMTVEKTLMTTPAYKCGGKVVVTTGTKTVNLQVHRLAGLTQYGTASQIAQFVDSVPKMNIASAYAGTNKTGGTGMFNDTAGTGSAHPNLGGPLNTAIVASGQEFQDAMAASVLAYHTKVPTILTPATSLSTTAVAALTNLHIQQVILLGGQLAVSNTVAKSIEAMGISVLRIAGKDYTDTAVQVAMFEMTSTTTGGLGWNPAGTAIVTRGNGFTDGLCGAVLDSATEHPLLLTENQTTVGTYLTAFLKLVGHTGINHQKISALEILGGPKAVTPTVISQMQADL